jgi:hypothetical protein
MTRRTRPTRRPYEDRRGGISTAWLRDNGYHVADFKREEGPAPEPQPTKLAADLQRGDEIRDPFNARGFVSVAEVQTIDGRIRVIVAGPARRFTGFLPDQPVVVSPHTAARMRRTG